MAKKVFVGEVLKSSKICEICNLTIALAEPTNHAKDCHYHCSVIRAIEVLINAGLEAPCVILEPHRFREHLHCLLDQVLDERIETSGKKYQAIQTLATEFYGIDFDVASMLQH